MIRWLWNALYGEEPATFRSYYGMTESVQRLSAATGKSVFSATSKQTAIGHVSVSRVSLQRVVPMIWNSCKPFYVGRFTNLNGQVVLEGVFTLSNSTKVLMTIWFTFVLLWTLLTLGLLFKQDPQAWWFPIFGVALFCAGAVLVLVARWFARNDVAWLSRFIQGTLSPQEPPNNLFQSTSALTRRRA